MPLDDNDFAINNPKLDSQIQASDFQNRVYTNPAATRSSLVAKVKQYKSSHAAANILRFPLDTPKYYMSMQISEYSRNNLFSLNFNVKDTIILPMPADPSNLSDHNQLHYDEEAIGTGLGVAANASTDKFKSLTKGIEGSAPSLSDAGNLLEAIGKGAGASIAGNIGKLTSAILPGAAMPEAKSIQALAEALAGYAPNQFFTILFRSPVYNKYQFTWAFMPRSKEESTMINQIVIKLKNAKAPGLALAGGLWRFPKIFRLAYYPNSQYLYKFKPAVMTDMLVNYAPKDAIAFYADLPNTPNAPEAVFITCTFMEMEYWLDGDYKDNNDPYDTKGPEGGTGVR